MQVPGLGQGQVAAQPEYALPTAEVVVSQPLWETYAGGVFTFIIFTVALAVVRSLVTQYAGKTNIKKEINKRVRRFMDKSNDNAANSNPDGHEMLPGLPNSDPSGQRDFDEEESKRPEDKPAAANAGMLGKTAGLIGSGFSSLAGGAAGLASKVGNLRGLGQQEDASKGRSSYDY